MRSKLFHAAALGLFATTVALSAQAGGGDNDMNPMYGDSWAALEGQGHNAGATQPRSHLWNAPDAEPGNAGALTPAERAGTAMMRSVERAEQRTEAAIAAWKDRLAATRPQGLAPANPFNDGTGA